MLLPVGLAVFVQWPIRIVHGRMTPCAFRPLRFLQSTSAGVCCGFARARVTLSTQIAQDMVKVLRGEKRRLLTRLILLIIERRQYVQSAIWRSLAGSILAIVAQRTRLQSPKHAKKLIFAAELNIRFCYLFSDLLSDLLEYLAALHLLPHAISVAISRFHLT